jgi:hypothetical protein
MLVMERFDESLVVLRHALGLSVEDVLYLKMKDAAVKAAEGQGGQANQAKQGPTPTPTPPPAPTPRNPTDGAKEVATEVQEQETARDAQEAKTAATASVCVALRALQPLEHRLYAAAVGAHERRVEGLGRSLVRAEVAQLREAQGALLGQCHALRGRDPLGLCRELALDNHAWLGRLYKWQKAWPDRPFDVTRYTEMWCVGVSALFAAALLLY